MSDGSGRARRSSTIQQVPLSVATNIQAQVEKGDSISTAREPRSTKGSGTPARKRDHSPSSDARNVKPRNQSKLATLAEHEETRSVVTGQVVIRAQPAELLENPLGRQEKVQNIIDSLIQQSGFSRRVVIHALIVNSGDVDQAWRYLKWNGEGQLNFKIWTYQEDQVILSKDQVNIALLIQQRGQEDVDRRIEFLEGLSTW